MNKDGELAFEWLRVNIHDLSSVTSKIGKGHIHQSFRLDLEGIPFFVQSINADIFRDVPRLMSQMELILKCLKTFFAEKPFETLDLLQNKSGSSWEKIENSYFRVFEFKQHLYPIDRSDDLKIIRSVAEAYAIFTNGLSTFPLSDAYVVIPHFHDLNFRLSQLNTASDNFPDRSRLVAEELSFVTWNHNHLKPMIAAFKHGKIPLRMVHNDTKLSNVLFGEGDIARCVVDLDTVMPGTVIYDVGDSLRSICTNLSEDDTNHANHQINQEIMHGFIDAYQNVMNDELKQEEIRWLPWSGAYMATIMGVRFLTDYLQGNTYFKVDYADHNLVRARNQLHLGKQFIELIK